MASAYTRTPATRITGVSMEFAATRATPAPNSWKIALPAWEMEFPWISFFSPSTAGSPAPLIARRIRVPARINRKDT